MNISTSTEDSAIMLGVKSHASASPAKPVPESKMKSGLPGTPEEQRRGLRATMKKHAETLRRLAQ